MNRRLIACLLGAVFALSGCAMLAREESEPSRPEAPQTEQPEPEPQPEPEKVPGVKGEYVVVGSTYLSDPPAGVNNQDMFLNKTLQLSDVLLLQWEVSNGKMGPTLIDAVDLRTGEGLYQLSEEGYAYSIEATGEQPEDYRIVFEDRMDFRCGSDPAKVDTVHLPESVRESLWQEDLAGIPYDILRPAELIAYSAADGIYTCDLNGENAAKVLDNTGIPSWYNYWGIPLPPYEPSQLHYVSPLIMNGGMQVAATSYLTGNGDYDSRPVGVHAMELESGQVSNYPDPIGWLFGPASRLNADTLLAFGEEAYLRIGVAENSVEDISYEDNDFHECRSWDYHTFARVEPGSDSMGNPQFTLSVHPHDNPQNSTLLLTVTGREYLNILSVTQSAVLCQAGEYEGLSSLMIVPYK